jgi:phospholipid/cholesterol/gamma-HCH transport system permease protein
MDTTAPRIDTLATPQGPHYVLRGRWTAAQFADPLHWDAIQADLAKSRATKDTPWNLCEAEQIDHIGAQLLYRHWGSALPTNMAMHPQQREMLERVARLTIPPHTEPPLTWRQRYLSLGNILLQWLSHARDFVRLIGQLFLDILRFASQPRLGPWRDISGHMYQFGATALPITALVGFLIGVVLAYLSAQQLKQFGADAYIVNLLGVSLVRELGPMLAAILIAGRSGSAITAQIGVMRVTEELDAMVVMGIPHGFRLVMPRALALALAMPLISVWTTVAALIGGMLAADISLGISPRFFINGLPDAVALSNLTLALFKSVVFGLLIALVGCHFGLRVKPNTESLGQGTTASVVTSITLVILVDALFAIIFKDVGI